MLFIFILLVFCSSGNSYIVKPENLNSAPYDIWAHYHWIWLANEEGEQNATIKLVNDYISYDIPVGAVNLDSSWPLNYNNFIWNQKYYKNASEMIDYFHSINLKVICWVTSMVNNDSSNFNEGKENGYFLNDGKLINWWHGNGALLDYSYPNAVDWWHKQMDMVLDIGIDGWKCDGTDPYVFELVVAKGHKGIITYREYADYYYRDFLYYTRQKRGQHALIMSRPVDGVLKFPKLEFLYLSYAPNDVMFSGWVGDQHGDWDGLKEALTNIIRSAFKGYLNFGSDIGGYKTDSGSKLGRTKEVFTRWFQFGALMPLMENGGAGEHRPWVFGNDTLSIYRVFANLHTNLAPFFLNAGTECYSKNISVLKPLTSPIFTNQPSNFDYLVHETLFVSPFTDNSTNIKLAFPGSKSQKLVYWFNNSIIYHGGEEVKAFNCPFSEFPLFVYSGSILPLQVDNHYTNLGTMYSKGYTTVLIMQPNSGFHSKNVHEFQSNGYIVEYNYQQNENLLEVLISAHSKNRFIILISNVYGENVEVEIARKTNNSAIEFETVEHYHDETLFWPTKTTASLFRKIQNKFSQLFVRVSEIATKGIYLKVKNLKVF